MCVVIAKHFKDIGWVIAKNRDQDYVSDITFEDEPQANVGEMFLLYDRNTGYREGMNYKGLTIITASLAANYADETDRADGIKIYEALKMSDPEKAAKYLIGRNLTGFIFVCNKDKLVLIEAAKDNDGKGKYHSTMRVVPHTELVARTNHGVEFPWAGFQKGIDAEQDRRRESSEERKSLAEKVAKNALTPQQILDNMAKIYNKDLQMNIFRVETKPKQMRTIFQWALVPAHDTIYCRPIQCRMKLRITKEKIQMKVLDNDVIKKIYNGRIKHFTKIKTVENGKYLEFTSESTLQYKDIIEGFRYEGKNRVV